MTSVANPHGRRLVGQPRNYRGLLAPGRLTLFDGNGRAVLTIDDRLPAESALLHPLGSGDGSPGWVKYAVVDLDCAPTDAFAIQALRALAACGVVFQSVDPQVRSSLARLNLVVVAPEIRHELAWYQLSVAASRQAALRYDPLLRHTGLAGPATPGCAGHMLPADTGRVPLPTVSVLLATRRRRDLERLLPRFATQTYPAFEVLIGTHGYRIEGRARANLAAAVPVPLRFIEAVDTEPVGRVLGKLSRLADGELLSKVDDDDHYGRQHLTDLVIGWRTSGADLIGKGSRFTYLPEQDRTVDRRWSATELDDVTVAGGTMLLPRRVLLEIGGWSESPRHEDTHLAQRVQHAGGVIHRIHGLDYAYVRRSTGHSWQTDLQQIIAQAGASYTGLPQSIVEH
jgi:hypothetical protein